LKSDENLFFLPIQLGKGDHDSDLYSLSLAVKLRLTNLQEIPFHIPLRETISFKLCNIIQGIRNQLKEGGPNLTELFT